MPTYNRRHTVVRAVRSAAAQQPQGVELEFVIVDDSTDDTLDVACRALAEFPSCTVVTHHAGNPRLRTNGARNLAIKMASGDFCVLLDSDDELAGGALEHIESFFRVNADIDVLFGSIENKSGRPRRGVAGLLDREVSYEELVSRDVGEFLPTVRRSVLVSSGMWFPQHLVGFEGMTWYGLARRGHRYFFTSRTMRLYDDTGTDRTTNPGFRLQRAGQFAAGHVALLKEFGGDIRRVSAHAYRKRLMKAMLYNRLADDRDSATDAFLQRSHRGAYRLLEASPRWMVRRMFDLGVRLYGDT
jgi:glycosyltransferase involved in cell wall biosynthesis